MTSPLFVASPRGLVLNPAAHVELVGIHGSIAAGVEAGLARWHAAGMTAVGAIERFSPDGA